MLRSVLQQIERHDRFVLTSHARPDGDAVGSVLACLAMLRQMGKQAQVVMRDAVPALYRDLPLADSIIQAPMVTASSDAAIILECDSLQRTALEGLDGRYLINIDHHYSGRPFANVNWIDPSACATAELIFALVRESGVKVSRDIATCLYTAVLTDTGMFANAGTSASTFGLAKELVLAGADPVAIARKVFFSNSTAKMRLLGTALSRLHREGAVAWMSVTRRDLESCGAADEDCEGLSNWALSIEGVEVAIFFREVAGGRGWRASLRSKGAINVAAIAERFGGGGHICASGCSLPGPLTAATERLLAQLRLPETRRTH
jgi:phosphoesterase RecJ-like protein